MITKFTSEMLARREFREIIETDLELSALLPDPALRPRHLQRELDRLTVMLQEDQATAIVAHDGLLVVRWLGWDSNHFEVPCADLFRLYGRKGLEKTEISQLCDAAEAELQARGIRFVSARIRTDQHLALAVLLDRGFQLVDTSVEIGQVEEQGQTPEDSTVRLGQASDEEVALSIADTFTDNRFFRDPHISDEQAAGVYRSWVRNALAARRLVVVERDGEVAALATIRPPDPWLQVATVGLVAVAPKYRGKGVFRALVTGCRQLLGGAALVTSTQVTNARALGAFGHCGLLPFGSRHVLHRWLQVP